jgi:hypothetical protein
MRILSLVIVSLFHNIHGQFVNNFKTWWIKARDNKREENLDWSVRLTILN